MLKKSLIAAVFAIVASPALVHAEPPILLGEAGITDFGTGGGAFHPLPAVTCDLRSVFVKVLGAPTEIDAFAVQFNNGQVQEIPVRAQFAPNSGSAWKELENGPRCIRAFIVRARSEAFSRDAVFELYGSKEMAPIGALQLIQPEASDGRFRPFQQDFCGLNQVMVKAMRAPAEIDHFAVQFADGEIESIPVRTHFDANTGSVWHPFAKPGRCLKAFSVIGRSDMPNNPTLFEIYAQ